MQVQGAISGLRESAASRTNKLQQEMSTMQDSTSSVKVEWSSYIQKAESHYCEDTAAVENGKKELEEVLQKWYQPLVMMIYYNFNHVPLLNLLML